MFYPITFKPIFKERVWGGRNLERLYQKPLPAGKVIGESWEISDRPEGVSQIANGPLAGKDLGWLTREHPRQILGATPVVPSGGFPLLVKILDAQQVLSVQVHPPPGIAEQLDGEPKTEMWYIAEAAPGAELFVGLKRGVTRQEFEGKLEKGTVAGCLHRLGVQAGDAMFLPSGRIHAIGAGLVLFEIQQNSDTTFRVFDWDRAGLDGKPRALQLQESLRSINFDDWEPGLIQSQWRLHAAMQTCVLVEDRLFRVTACRNRAAHSAEIPRSGKMQIVGVLEGRLQIKHALCSPTLGAGNFCLLPACLDTVGFCSETETHFLVVETD